MLTSHFGQELQSKSSLKSLLVVMRVCHLLQVIWSVNSSAQLHGRNSKHHTDTYTSCPCYRKNYTVHLWGLFYSFTYIEEYSFIIIFKGSVDMGISMPDLIELNQQLRFPISESLIIRCFFFADDILLYITSSLSSLFLVSDVISDHGRFYFYTHSSFICTIMSDTHFGVLLSSQERM